MQRIITLEEEQTFELPAGEFTVKSIGDHEVSLISDSNTVKLVNLKIDEPFIIDDIQLTLLERHENCVHVRVDSNRRFIASEMSVGGFEDNAGRTDTVVVIAHR